MLQVARLAPRLLHDSSELVRDFVLSRLLPEGGFADREEKADLYYTVFGIECLLALQADIPSKQIAAYLQEFGDGEGLDLVHLACLARAWASLPDASLEADKCLRLRDHARRLRRGGAEGEPSERDATTASGSGAAPSPRFETEREFETVYDVFLMLGIEQDAPFDSAPGLLDRERAAATVQAMETADGSYGNQPAALSGTTPAAAAAATIARHLEFTLEHDVGKWLLDACYVEGGFRAAPATPLPDLLSTATALHALAGQQRSFDHLREPCLDFVDSLWTNRGGFLGHWADDVLDCEYTYYGLLALGHLALVE